MNNNFDYQGAKQAGYSDQEIQSYLASKQPQQPQQQPQQEGGSMLGNLLPIIFGTVGSIGGSVLDPVLGPLGTIGGGAAGSGFGQWLSDIFQKKQPTMQDIGGQALAGGVGGGFGKALEPVFGAAGKVLSRFSPVKALDNAGTGLISSQYNVDGSAGRSLKIGDTVDQLSKYGISNKNDIVPHADTVINTISKLNRDTVAHAPPVDTAGILKMTKDLISTSPTTGDDKIINFVTSKLSAMNGGAAGTMEPQAHAADVFEAIQQLEKKANEINRVPKFQQTQEAINTSHIYNQVANELKDRLYTGLQPDGTMSPFGGADHIVAKTILSPDSPEYQALAKVSPVLANEVATAQTVGARRSLMAPFVRGSQLANETEARSQIGFNNVGGAVKGLAKGFPTLANPGAPIQQLLGTDAVNAGVGQGLKNASQLMDKIPMPSSSLLASITGQGAGHAMNQPAGPTQAEAAPAIPQPTSQQTTATADSTSPQEAKQEQFKQLLGTIMLTHAKNASELIAAYNFMNPQTKETEAARVDKQKASGIQKLIQNMQENVGKAKYIGPFRDILQKAEQKTGRFGGGDQATNDLNQNMAVLQQLIATEVHRRGMSESSLKTMYDAFPHSNDSHEAYVQKLNHLQDMMSTYFGSQ